MFDSSSNHKSAYVPWLVLWLIFPKQENENITMKKNIWEGGQRPAMLPIQVVLLRNKTDFLL